MQQQQQLKVQEQKDDVKDTKRSKSLLPSLPIEYENILSKASPRRLSARFNRPSSLTDIRTREALRVVPLNNNDDLLEIRSNKQYGKSISVDSEESSIVTLNISGNRFQTYLSTLELYPDTLLGDKKKRKRFWNSKTEEYFFDRNRSCFEAILYYYQSNGNVRRPESVPIDTFIEEVTFFQLGEEVAKKIRETENIKPVEEVLMPHMLWRRYLWFYLEFPQHSLPARIIMLTSTLFTILSCVTLAIESLPAYTNRWDNICKAQANISLNATYTPRCAALFYSPFFIVQTVCVVFFTTEFFLRIISTPSYRRFLLSFFNWIDLGAIIPYYVFLVIQLADKDIGLNTNAVLSIRLLRVLRFSRIFKIYLVFKRLKSLRVLSATVKESLIDFVIMVTIVALLGFLFGAAVYFAEQNANGDVFDSIPKAVYWGIITMTGVGYGDMVPITYLGRIITCLCALSGPATMGMLISVFVDRYQRVYNRKMYIWESEAPPTDIDLIHEHDPDDDDDTKSVTSSQKAGRRRPISEVISHSLSSLHDKIKHDHHHQHHSLSEAYDLQLIVSFNNKKNNKGNDATDHLVTMMKKKLTEAVSTVDIDVNLKLIDHDSKELWKISSVDSSLPFTPTIIVSSDVDDTYFSHI
ncbi:unnamed protein product [Adineta steineri]|uniref:BTB domain-containing protein n=1 Tax=Adineta steineri TaxID=433720 RepID=A0A818XWV4_9BILA|nr:unnamed protein product [Adineta steineri]CAF3743276.1 unnamed protein product [Adineta steineri]